MVENEKIIKDNIKLPESVLPDEDTIKIEDKEEIKIEEPEEIKIEENNQDTAKADEIQDVSIFGTTFDVNTAKPIKEKSKIENIKVVETKFTEDQQKDINKLLEADVSIEDAKKIVQGIEVDTKPINFEGKSEYEAEKEFLKKEGIDLDLIIKSEPEAASISEQIFVDSAGTQTTGGVISTKLLYELNGYKADKDSEIKGNIRLNLGFGLDGAQFKENNIKNMLIKRITESGKYDDETLAKYLDQIQVKTVTLQYDEKKKQGLVYRIPKELGGTNMFAAVDSPKLSMDDLSDAVADSGPIVASIIAGTFGSAVGPVGTVAASGVAAGYTEYARLMYGYHVLGLQNDLYNAEQFKEIAEDAAIKYGLIDAAATGVFLAGAKLILPTILNKNQLSTNTIKEFIATKGAKNTGVFNEVEKVKLKMKKTFNLTDSEVDDYFAVSLGKAILNSDQLIKKSSAAQRTLLSDEVTKLENKSRFKAIEDKIIKQTTGVSEVGNKAADDIILNIEKNIKETSEIALREAELIQLKNSKALLTLEKSFVDDAASTYLDEFGITLNPVYKKIQARLSTLDEEIANGISKNKTPIIFNVKEALKILTKDLKKFSFKRGTFPKGLKTITKKSTPKQVKEIIENNKLFRAYQLITKGSFSQTGKEFKTLAEGFEVLQKKKNITLEEALKIKNALNLSIETLDKGTVRRGGYIQLSKNLTKSIDDAIIKSEDTKLAKLFKDRLELLNLKRTTFFKNFGEEFANGGPVTGITNLKFTSGNLFERLVSNSTSSRTEAMAFGKLIDNGLVPPETLVKIQQALLRNYFNKVMPGANNLAEMTHKEFFKKFGKNYESLLGKKLYNELAKSSDKAFSVVSKVINGAEKINSDVAKFLPGLENWSVLRNSGPGEIVEHILSPAFGKTANLTKLLQALPTETVRQIRTIYLSRMMKEVSGPSFMPTGLIEKTARMVGGTPMKTGTLNGAKLNAYLNTNRSTILQMYSPEFFSVMRTMGDVLEMLQVPSKLAQATKTSIKDATENAALFIDMFYGPLNHKRLILNRASRLLDKFGLSQDNLMLFTDYGLFIEAAQKNFLAGNYPRWMTKLPQKERSVFVEKVMKAINKSIDIANRIGGLGFPLNQGAGLRKTFTANPLKNPLVLKEYLEDKFEGDDDRMKDNADIFYPVDATAKFAIEALQAVFSKGKELTIDKAIDAVTSAKEVEKKDIRKEKFEEKLN